jgi:ABC-type transporter Mla subunit MlaD
MQEEEEKVENAIFILQIARSSLKSSVSALETANSSLKQACSEAIHEGEQTQYTKEELLQRTRKFSEEAEGSFKDAREFLVLAKDLFSPTLQFLETNRSQVGKTVAISWQEAIRSAQSIMSQIREMIDAIDQVLQGNRDYYAKLADSMVSSVVEYANKYLDTIRQISRMIVHVLAG